MGKAYARDSFMNLLDLKQQQEDREEPRREGRQIQYDPSVDVVSFAQSYESFEEVREGESNAEQEAWPIWEMTGCEHAWTDTSEGLSHPSVEGSGDGENGGNSDHNADKTLSIAECERIFTVPEVYDEVQRNDYDGDDDDVGPCRILHCLNPWKQPIFDPSLPGAADRVSTNAQRNENPDDNDQERRRNGGVIKRSSMAVQLYLGMPASTRQSFTPSMFKISLDDGRDGGRRRPSIAGNDHRQIFAMGNEIDDLNGNDDGPNTDTDVAQGSSAVTTKKRRIHFSELKQVLQIRKITPEEAPDIWYQVEDFDTFKNEMASLVQQDGASRKLAETWLEAHSKDTSASQLSTDQERGEDTANDVDKDKSPRGSKSWWHEYDHSRRGLEKYASPVRARQVFASMKVAIEKVLKEQRRQSMFNFFCVPGATDPQRIAEMYHEYTAWSRDLAIAAGASDADAVSTNFDDNKRHTREYYLLKQVVANGYKVHKHMPQFMLPNCIEPKGYIDETDSMYCGKKNKTLLKKMISTVADGREQTGEEAREEMSRLHSEHLTGPMSPALAVALKAAAKEGEEPSKPSLTGQKTTSMSQAAKNYPFQK